MTLALRSLVVPPEYLPLFKYLDGRYADTEVAVSPQSRSWIKANRTAVPNLKAQIVVFDRTSA